MKKLVISSIVILFICSFSVKSSKITGRINTDCFGATTESILDEVIRYSRHKDESGILKLMSSGKVVLLKRGTSVSMVSSGFTVTRIEVKSGSYAGVKLYVPVELVTFSQ